MEWFERMKDLIAWVSLIAFRFTRQMKNDLVVID